MGVLPAALARHVAEEAPGFAAWARRNARAPELARRGAVALGGAAVNAAAVAQQVYGLRAGR